MAQIKPFAAIRYDKAVVGELSKVTSPPYDIISPEDRVYYHKLHPNNFVRLVLGEEFRVGQRLRQPFHPRRPLSR